MAYDWEGKRADCHRMYVDANMSLEQVMQWFEAEHGFAPSRRAFQSQFKKWGFPSKQSSLQEDEILTARVKELWEANVGQRDMLQQLNEEGFAIGERELMRLRGKKRWLLRSPNGEALAAGLDDGNCSTTPRARRGRQPAQRQPGPTAEPDPNVLQRRQESLQQRQAESDERWAARKRRRRTRGWAGLPADPEGPPRYPSETTLDESKAVLQMDNDIYRNVRDQFQAICEQEGITKKTLAGPDKWQQAKDRLITQSKHLEQLFRHDDRDAVEQKLLALDVVCLDVTKRMRVMQTRVTIADAKNVLAINPEESRQLRAAFFAKLRGENFTSKTELGQKRWDQLKEEWIADSPLLQRIVDVNDPEHQSKLKAVEMLCRDVMKRLRDELARRDPGRQKQSRGAGFGPAHPRHTATREQPVVIASGSSLPGPPTPDRIAHSTFASGDLQIDPSLLLAASDALPHMLSDDDADRRFLEALNQPLDMPSVEVPPRPPPIGIFMRLHHDSPWQGDPKLWLGALQTSTLAELRQQVTAAHPRTTVARVAGIVKTLDGTEISYSIDDDAKLAGYLAHTSGGEAMFDIVLASTA